MRKTPHERFWEKVDVRGPAECWPWRASFRTTGYGQMNVGGTNEGAHRLALVFSGRYPQIDAKNALHTCDNKACCNPAHLYWGSHSENMRDSRDRLYVGGKQKLTAAQAEVIRTSTARVTDLCAEFGISRWQVTNIRSGRQWTRD